MRYTLLIKTAVLFLLAAAICMLCLGCAGKKPQPEDTVHALQEAINDLDTDRLLQCIDSARAEQLRELLALTAEATGIRADRCRALLDILFPFLSFIGSGTEDLFQVTLTVLDTTILDDTAVVDLMGTVTCGEYERSFTATAEMVLEDGAWVISGLGKKG